MAKVLTVITKDRVVYDRFRDAVRARDEEKIRLMLEKIPELKADVQKRPLTIMSSVIS